VTVAFVSGSAGLTHQLLWTRRLVDLLGAEAGTFARVIGAFFAGLALGAWFASRPAPPSTSFWKRIAWAELGVALLAVPVLVSAQFADWIWSRPAIGSWTPFFAPPLLVLPPAVFMGLVLPWILRALADHADANRTVRLYAANLMGGIAGIALVMWLGLPRLGRPRVGPRSVAGGRGNRRGTRSGRPPDPVQQHLRARWFASPVQPGTASPSPTAWIEWDAGRNILGQRRPWFVGVPLAEYVRDLHRAGGLLLPEQLRASHDAGQFFLTVEIAAHIQHPALDELTAQIQERLPSSMAADLAAAWQTWPMRSGLRPNPILTH
jgi:hypothetical protein